MVKAVYAGSFDPLTNGHLWMVEQGSRLFEELVIAVGVNPDKKYAFNLEDRLNMLRKSVRNLSNVNVDSFESQFLVNYASSVKAEYILRGIRSEGDYEFERGMRNVNSDLNPQVTSIFLMPPREIAEVSSSLVKGLVGPRGWEEIVERYIPSVVYNQFLAKFNGFKHRWDALIQNLHVESNTSESYSSLVKSYSENQRIYHNLVHLANSFKEFDKIRTLLKNPLAVETAIWYHDSVYDPKSKDNEEKSAELAQKHLKQMNVDKKIVDSVYQMILETKHDCTPLEGDARYLVDIDLSILGMPEKEFKEYENGIREEYDWVSEMQFKEGRSRILRGFLERPVVFATDLFRDKYEMQARKNLVRSIEQLR